MREDGYTILAPQMAREHFRIMEGAFKDSPYKIEFLNKIDKDVINEGLKYVNNDSCYPSITVVGQMLEAVNSGRYDTDKIALLMTQTGLSLIHISEPTRLYPKSRMPSSA